MIFSGQLGLERRGDEIVLRSTNSGRWFGPLLAGFAVLWLILWSRQGSGGALDYGFGLFLRLAFAMFGLVISLPITITTTFDVRARRVVHKVSLGKMWDVRRNSHAFAELAGLGVQEYVSEDHFSNNVYSYLPVLVLRGGKTRWLAMMNGSYKAMGGTMEEVCTATGLAMIQIPHRPN